MVRRKLDELPDSEVAEEMMRKKFLKVERIEAGVEVINTNIAEFHLLGHVEEISNKNGPALLFKGNTKLVRIRLPKLKKLNGNTVQLRF